MSAYSRCKVGTLSGRAPGEGLSYHIPTAQSMPLASLTPDFAAHNEKLILCSDDGTEAAKAWFLLEAQGYKSVYLLDGGLQAWQETVLFPRKTAGSDTVAYARLVQVAKYFGGTPQPDSTAVPTTAAPPLPKLSLPVLPASSDVNGLKSQPRKKKEGC